MFNLRASTILLMSAVLYFVSGGLDRLQGAQTLLTSVLTVLALILLLVGFAAWWKEGKRNKIPQNPSSTT